jgi:uncharacterized protein
LEDKIRITPVMKIVISPAKSLNFEKELPTAAYSEAAFLKESRQVHKVLKQKSPNELSELMTISDNLAQLNWQRNQDWKTPFTTQNARAAIYTFDGDVYTGLDAFTIPLDKLDDLQDSLRILSGLYGLLKPLDLMQAYRLEMGTKLPIGDAKNLHEFWKPIVTKAMNKELDKGELFINLASTEYFTAVDVKTLLIPMLKQSKILKDLIMRAINLMPIYQRGISWFLRGNVSLLELVAAVVLNIFALARQLEYLIYHAIDESFPMKVSFSYLIFHLLCFSNLQYLQDQFDYNPFVPF